MPSLSTLVDNFNDGTIGPNWGNSYGGVTETGGRARVPCNLGYAGCQTAYSWTLTGASLYVAVLTVPAISGATEAYASVFVNAPGIEETGGPLYGCRVGFIINAVTGQLRCTAEVGYYEETPTLLTYSAVTHKFLRLSEAAGTVSWDTSPDGTTWTNRRTLATPAWVTDSTDQCALDLSAHRNAGTVDYAEYDNVNTLNDGAVHTASAALSCQSNLAATPRTVAHTAAALSADAALNASTALLATATATLSAHSQMTAAFVDYTVPEEVAGLAAGEWELYIEQGATFVQAYDCTVDAPTFTWTGWNARAQIRTSTAANADLLLDLTPYLAIAGGVILLSIPAAITQTLTRNGRWDLEMVNGTVVVRLLQGPVTVSPEVTR